ncbi:MAG: uracil-DNA glycosylase [Acidimicrobiia bacterium]
MGDRRGASPDSSSLNSRAALVALGEEVASCRKCPRLVDWREEVAGRPSPRFADQHYWGRPIAGFGDADARLLVVGLAPAAHGGNRTGRVFTGDRSGDFLFGSLHRTGFANQATSTHVDDGLALSGVYITAAVRCAPPANRPSPEERDRCAPYLVREIELLPAVRAIVVLGAFAYEATWRALRSSGASLPRPRPRFAHGAEAQAGYKTVLCSFHPSQQNTFTGRLTPEMLDGVFLRASELS